MEMRTRSGVPPVEFYEKVLVLETAAEACIRGRYGWVLGVSADDAEGIIHDYQVHFDEFDIGFGVLPEDLQRTGEIASRERFYSGESIRVQVDAQVRGFPLTGD